MAKHLRNLNKISLINLSNNLYTDIQIFKSENTFQNKYLKYIVPKLLTKEIFKNFFKINYNINLLKINSKIYKKNNKKIKIFEIKISN